MVKSPSKAVTVAIPWYRPDNYSRALEVMTDREALPSTFDEWQRLAEDFERLLKGHGHIVVRADLDPDQFLQWCRLKGHGADAPSRAEWASEVARERERGSD